MGASHAMTLAQTVILRCTTNGHTRWQHVAAQLGRCIDSVRAEHDPTYLRSHIWAPSREARPEMIEPEHDIDDMRSPRPKERGLRFDILARLSFASASAETIAAAVEHSADSVRPRLTQLKQEGMISHTARLPYTWSLTDEGKTELTALRQGKASVGRDAA